MKQTTNYQLPQWEETDRIMMKDFNGAMEKIDGAFGGIERAVKLKEMVLSSDRSSFDLTLDDIDLTRYERLIIRMEVDCDGILTFRPNGSTTTYTWNSFGSSGTSKHDYISLMMVGEHAHGALEIYAHPKDGSLLWYSRGLGNDFAYSSLGFNPSIQYQDIRRLAFSQGGTVKTGSRFRVYGVPNW